MEKLESKEIAIIKKNISSALSAVQGLVIADQKGLEKAVDIRSKIKSIGKQIKAMKETITKPLNEALSAARAVFNPMEAQYKEAEDMVSGKMIAYDEEVSAKAREEELKLAARVEKGTLKMETAAKKLEDIERVDTSVQGKTGTAQFRVMRKVEIMDSTKLPRRYLIPDEVLIRKDALSGIAIEGVRVYEEKIIAGSSR